MATALSVPITYFFEDLTPGGKIEIEPIAKLERHREYLSSKEGYKLIDTMSTLPRLPICPPILAVYAYKIGCRKQSASEIINKRLGSARYFIRS